MILLCGIPSEAPLRAVIDAAERLGVEHLVLNQRVAGWIDFTVDIDGVQPDGWIGFGGDPVPLHAIDGVYVRVMDFADLPEHVPARAAARPRVVRSRVLHAAFHQWLEFAPCRVLNRPSAMASNMSKPFQSQLIAGAGFSTPPTLVTSDPAQVRAFRSRHERVVYKSMSSIRSIVQELDDAREADLARIAALPTQFQALVEGVDIRVHVVGTHVFATEVRSDRIDYRYACSTDAPVELRPVDLPREVASRCIEMSRRLQLPLCGIDLRRTPEGDYVCFEVNPSPAFSYYEEHTGQPIADAIVAHLARRDE